MTGKTHIVGGLALATATTSLAGLYQPRSVQEAAAYVSFFIVPAVVGSLAPDIDHGNSKASNVNIFTKILSIFIRIVCGHRGVVHSPVFMAGLGIVLYGVLSWLGSTHAIEITAGFTVGYFSHLLIDMTNASGIPLFFPFLWESKGSPKKFSIMKLREGGIAEFLMWTLLVGLTGMFGYMVWMGV